MKKLLLALSASTLALCSAVPAFAAEIVKIDVPNSSINVTSNGTLCVLGSCALSATLASSLPSELAPMNVGDRRTFDFARLSFARGFGTGTAVLDATLAFLNPTGEITTGGVANYFRFGGFFTPGVTGGTLAWTNPTQALTASTGSKYTVSLNPISGIEFGNTSVARATISFDSIAVAGAVPEPATWAIMIFGMGAVGGAMRRRKSLVTTKVAFA